ncbi:MAG: iron donor protein CyaY [Burkholderiales bacterium]|nr:MAG: iron donor protein CyaY [Burkholderiales bacterium]
MTEQDFLKLADATLAAIEDALDAAGADVETQREGPLLELEFDDGSKVIVNGQPALGEIWVAARAGGFHFRREQGRWVDTRSGEELYALLSRVVSLQAGAAVTLSEPPAGPAA